MKSKLKRILRPVNNERGSIHILLFAMLGIITSTFIFIIAINWMLQTFNTDKSKALLDHASRAASMNIVPTEAALGRLVWDDAAGINDFNKYLQLNFKLDTSNNPLPGSHLSQPPVVHSLEFVSAPTYPYMFNRSVTIAAGTSDETTRNVNVTIYGPSVLAVLEVRQSLIGLGRSEPILLSSVASVRFR